MSFGYFLMGTLARVICRDRLRFFPINTAPVVGRVISSASTALRLLSRDRASAGVMGASTRDAQRRVAAATLRISKRW